MLFLFLPTNAQTKVRSVDKRDLKLLILVLLMNRIVQIKVFNDLLDQFLDYLETTFPYFRSDVVLTKSTVQFIRKSNPRLVVKQFMKHVGPYKTHVIECNEDFFLSFEKNLSSEMNTENILVGMKIRNMWVSPSTTDMQKAHIWLYFQKLLRAGEMVTQ